MASEDAALFKPPATAATEGDIDPRFALVLKDVAAGAPVHRALRDNGWNNKAFYALISTNADAGERYARAKTLGLDALADEIIEIADESRRGTKRTTKADGAQETVEADMVDRSRLQIDARKWLLSKLAPKKYGEKLDIEHGGNVTVTIVDADL